MSMMQNVVSRRGASGQDLRTGEYNALSIAEWVSALSYFDDAGLVQQAALGGGPALVRAHD